MHALNKQQKEAVFHTEGPLLVIAGAGAGKTKVITERVANIIKKGVAPSKVLAITFTNKAAKEMRERINKILESDKDLNRPVSNFERPFVSTFHALGVHIIKENCKILGLNRHFSIFDRGDSLSAMKEGIKNLGLDPKQFEPGRFLSLVSREKGNGASLSEFREKADKDGLSISFISIWEQYEKKLRQEKALDFDDLLLKSLELLKNPDIRRYYQNIWRYIHIDEYQDTNKVQYEMIKMLAGETQNVCAVGDQDQSIYGWRGADFKNIMRFEKDFPNTKVILLEENYRSTKTIIEAANQIISKNILRKEKTLFTKNEDGEKITIYNAANESDEANFVAETSLELIDKGVPPEEIAVLYRANFQSRILEEAFLNYKIPYQVLGVRFFERKEVKDLISYLKTSLSEENLSDFKRIINFPPRGIGKVSVLKIMEGRENTLSKGTLQNVTDLKNLLSKIKEMAFQKPLSETLIFILRESGIEKHLKEKTEDEERLENLYELVTLATKYDSMIPEKGVENFLADAALASDQDELKEERPAVRLMTVHASKGLEFSYVFVTGLEEDLFPHKRMGESNKKIEENEEERRLFYVALTRSKKKLYLSHTAFRTIFGSPQINVPSQFLTDIDESLLDQPFSEGVYKTIYLQD